MPELKKSEFFEIYRKHVGSGTNYIMSYHKAEAEHIKMFNQRRYSNYQSFRQVYNRDMKKR